MYDIEAFLRNFYETEGPIFLIKLLIGLLFCLVLFVDWIRRKVVSILFSIPFVRRFSNWLAEQVDRLIGFIVSGLPPRQ
jgi:hypothetical protein